MGAAVQLMGIIRTLLDPENMLARWLFMTGVGAAFRDYLGSIDIGPGEV